MRIGRRTVFAGPGRPLEIWEQDVADAPPGGVLVRVKMAGVCGSDAHRLAGDDPTVASLRMDGGGSAQARKAVAFGHEGVGVVEQLGSGVTTDRAGLPLRVGDAVYWNPVVRCGHCRPCIVHPTGIACDHLAWPPSATEPSAAAFQDYATLSPSIPVFRIPDDTPPEAVIAFGCAMPTALAGFSRLGFVNAEESIVVQGCGPVGLAATMLAALTQARQVIVIGAGRERLAAALQLGATSTISLDGTTAEDRRQSVLDMTEGRGADIVLEAAGQLPAFAEGIDLIADHGRYLLMGMYSGVGKIPVDPFRINNLSLRIIGSLGAEPAVHMRTVHLAQRHHERLGLASLVSHRFPLTETAKAIETTRRGASIKAVVTPADGR